MSRRRKLTDTTPFDSIRLEGTLFVPELLERAANGEAAHQKESDYAVPRGLKLHDEYGRAFRIATALWQDFAAQLPRTDLDATTVTQTFIFELLRECLNYTDLVSLDSPITHGDRGFPITSQAAGGRVPVIIAPHRLGLDDPDTRFAIHGSGSKKKSAHQLAQEFLNASRDCLWAIVTNGRTLRLLRDADTLTRPNFLEFDLETILRDAQHRYADFSALWRILHASRAGSAGTAPNDSIWEKWKTEGHSQGLRVRNGLRDGVQEALLILGRGFLTHPENSSLRQVLHEGTLTTDAYFQQLLRLIYRSLFLFCLEERDLLHPSAPEDEKDASVARAARQAYATGFSLRRLRSRSLRHTAHDVHGDLWQSVTIVFQSLAKGQIRLALPALGGLFADTQCPDLDGAALTNRDLLAAMRHLRWFFDKKSGQRGAIDYRNMGPEELGSVYESLLELVPQLDLPARSFGFAGITDDASTSGNARKTTGSYYTPDSLVQELIKSALDPVIADRLATQPDRPIEALLSITVCDPSCGSGHFLLAAARRLAEKLAELRAPDGAVRPDDYRHALREVASRCLYGVDINPMAVELCRVALWLETVDPGKPLGFLNHHIRTGNSLLGTTPDLIAAGLPDDTFTAIEGDDKPACAELKKRNKKEREGFGPLFEKEEQTIRDRLRQAATQIEAMDDSQPAALQQKEAAFTTSETAPEYRHAKLLADLWCAAFVIKKTYPAIDEAESPISNPPSQIAQLIEGHLLHTQDELFGQSTPAPAPTKKAKQPKTKNQEQGTASGITTAHLRDFVQGKSLPADLQTEVEALARQYRFFHWHLAFPQVFDQGGFACILGNPPWDKIQPEEEKFFTPIRPDIAKTANAKVRKELIQSLGSSDPTSHAAWISYKSEIDASCHFLSASGRLKFAGDGNLNTYRIFTELSAQLAAPKGRSGLVVQSGIATDESGKELFHELLSNNRIVRFWDFENREGFFPDVDSRFRFCLLTLTGQSGDHHTNGAEFGWMLHSLDQCSTPERLIHLSADDLSLFNPSSQTCPVFVSLRDFALGRLIYLHGQHVYVSNSRRIGTIDFLGELFNLTRDSRHFVNRGDGSTQGSLPLYEAKYLHQFDHRFATTRGDSVEEPAIAEKQDASFTASTSRTVSEDEVRGRLAKRGINASWLMGFRDIASATNERTCITAVFPTSAVGNSINLILGLSALEAAAFMANANSFIFDFCCRQKVSGTHVNIWIFKQLPAIAIETYAQPCPWANDPKSEIPNPPSLRDWFLPRVMELTYTAWDLEAFASDCGWSGPPFRWDEERRFHLRCELDAAFFHLYLGPQSEWQQQPEALTRAFPTPRQAVSYIMDTFPIVKRKDETKHGHYRTKETILKIYDALGAAMQTGVAYQTLLDPVPACLRVAHQPRLPQQDRIALTQARAYWLEFLVAAARLSGDEFTLEQLWEAYLIILSAPDFATEAESVLGDTTNEWISSLSTEPAEPGLFADMLETLNANGRLIRMKVGGQIRLKLSADIPVQPDAWRTYDAAAALAIYHARPAALKLETTTQKPAVRREVARYETLERKFA